MDGGGLMGSGARIDTGAPTAAPDTVAG
jgi:hypothetical protein